MPKQIFVREASAELYRSYLRFSYHEFCMQRMKSNQRVFRNPTSAATALHNSVIPTEAGANARASGGTLRRDLAFRYPKSYPALKTFALVFSCLYDGAVAAA
jgi:hypothetical protein